jgi:PEP-CTERM motif
MSLRSLLLPLLSSLVLLASTTAHAALLISEDFSHDDGVLLGQSPTPGPGGSWAAHSNEGSQPILVSSGQAVLTQHSGNGGREDLNSSFAPRSETATTYAAFDLLLPSSTNLTGDPAGLRDSSGDPLDDAGLYFAHFMHGSSSNFRARTGIVQPASGGDFGLAINGNGQNLGSGTSWPSDLSFDTTYRIVISYNAGTGDAELWVDPTDESSPSILDDKDSIGDLIQGFGLRQNTDYEGQQLIDNLCVATSFNQALTCTVPEPASCLLLLAGLALVGIVKRQL